MAFKSVQEGQPQGIIIRVDEQVYRTLSRKRRAGWSFDDVLREIFGFPRREKWVRKRGE